MHFVDKVKKLAAESGSKLTCKLLQKVIQDEAALIMTNQPERSEYLKRTFGNNIVIFSYNFAARNREIWLWTASCESGLRIERAQGKAEGPAETKSS